MESALVLGLTFGNGSPCGSPGAEGPQGAGWHAADAGFSVGFDQHRSAPERIVGYLAATLGVAFLRSRALLGSNVGRIYVQPEEISQVDCFVRHRLRHEGAALDCVLKVQLLGPLRDPQFPPDRSPRPFDPDQGPQA